MKKRETILLAAIVLLTIAAALLILRPEDDPAAAGPSTDPTVTDPAPDKKGPDFVVATDKPKGPIEHTRAGRRPYDIGVKNDTRVTHTEDGKHIMNEAIAIAREITGKKGIDDPKLAPDFDPEEDARLIFNVLEFYRMVFNQNPVAGDNQSVMAALMGENDRDVVLFPDDHPSLSPLGELLDPWETPYLFHAVSAQLMEIVSPGPDRVLGTPDDIIFTERDENLFFQGLTEPPDFGVEGEDEGEG